MALTEKQQLALLNAAIKELKLTKEGYPRRLVQGTHWARAMTSINKLKADLQPDPVPRLPAIGPVYNGGGSLLDYQLTHATSGIDFYPAFDTAFSEGMAIIAPEPLLVSRSSSSRPGLAFYAIGAWKLKYWFGHLDRTHESGKRFKKGELIGRVCRNSIGGGPHTHIGVNVEELIGRGKQLKYGKNGDGPNYTFGSPSIRKQLIALLEAA